MLKLKNYSVEGILDSIDLEFEKGKTYVIMGSNGVGKSTLMHSIMGKPDYITSGEILFNSEDISSLPVFERARKGIFLAFQTPTSIPGLSNFQLIKQAKGLLSKDIATELASFKKMSSDLKLPDDWHKRNVNTDASGGEKKKNELIQLNMMNVDFAMLDEPDSGLDVDGIKSLISNLNKWRNENNTLVVVTHYDKLINGLSPDHVIVLKKHGVVLGDIDTAKEIFEKGFESV